MMKMVSGERFLFKIICMIFLLQIVLLPKNSFANDISEGEILRRVEKIGELGYLSFIDEMKDLSKLTKSYVQVKSEECSGEFSSYIINSKGEKVIQKKKLNRKEKRLCLYMLITFRTQFTRHAYNARLKHLEVMQKKQKEELEKLGKIRVAELQVLARKYR